MTEFTESVEAAFEAAGADESGAATAAAKIAAYREDHDEDLTVDDVEDGLAAAPEDDFGHAYNWLVGDLAASNDDCTDTREYRLDAYGDLAADPSQGT